MSGEQRAMNKEFRFLQKTFEVRADGERKIGGYAAVFEQLSQPLWGFVEKIAKGAFASSLEQDDVRALWSHNTDLVLGRTGNGTLSLREDDHGLAFDLELPDTTLGRDTYESIKRGDVTGVSFGFEVLEDSWQRKEEGAPHIRTLNKVKLYEISPTAFPAYEQTAVAVRSGEAVLKEAQERWAREQLEATSTARIKELYAQVARLERGLPFNI